MSIAPDGSLLTICPDGNATPGASSSTVFRLPPGGATWQRIGATPGGFDLVSTTGPVWCVASNPDQVTALYTAQLPF